MAWVHPANTTVQETILAILCGREWPMDDQQIWNDQAWSYVYDETRPDHDFKEGAPSNTTMEYAYRELLSAGLIQKATGSPRAFIATELGNAAGDIPRRLIAAAYRRN